MSDTAAWPIRVGGIYKSNAFDVEAKVCAIDGDMVHWCTRSVHAGKIGAFGAVKAYSLHVFRDIYSPEEAALAVAA